MRLCPLSFCFSGLPERVLWALLRVAPRDGFAVGRHEVVGGSVYGVIAFPAVDLVAAGTKLPAYPVKPVVAGAAPEQGRPAPARGVVGGGVCGVSAFPAVDLGAAGTKLPAYPVRPVVAGAAPEQVGSVAA